MTRKNVTQATVDQWLAVNRPNLATYAHGRNKGTYSKDMGPAASFVTRGTTWKQVLESFGN